MMRVFKNALMIALVSIAIISCSKKQEDTPNGPAVNIEEQGTKGDNSNALKAQEEAELKELGKANHKGLVGVWVLSDAECASSDGIIFAANGKYTSAEETGSWNVVGDKLIVNAIANPPSEGDGEYAVALNGSDNGADHGAGGGELNNDSKGAIQKTTWTLKIFEVDDKKAVLHRANGKNVIWKRCPNS